MRCKTKCQFRDCASYVQMRRLVLERDGNERFELTLKIEEKTIWIGLGAITRKLSGPRESDKLQVKWETSKRSIPSARPLPYFGQVQGFEKKL